MGEPVKIVDLAKPMIELTGLKIGEDIEIIYTGLRPNGKFYEELLSSKENTKETQHEKIRVKAVREYSYAKVLEHMSTLNDYSTDVDMEKFLKEMIIIVLEFKSKNSIFKKFDH